MYNIIINDTCYVNGLSASLNDFKIRMDYTYEHKYSYDSQFHEMRHIFNMDLIESSTM